MLPRSLKKKAPIQQLVNAVGLNDHRILFEVLGEEPLTITQMLKTVGVTNLHSLLKLDTTDLTELLEISDKQTTKLLHFAKAALSFAKQNNDRRKKENKPLNSASSVPSVPSVPSAPPVQSTPSTPPTPSTPSTSSAPIKPPLEPKPKKIPKTKRRPTPVVQVPTNNKRETVIDEHNTGVSKDKTFADDLFSMFPEFNALRKEVNQANEEADEADSRIVSEGFNNLFPTLKLTEVHIDDITDEDERDQEREQERKHQENSVPPPPSPLPTTKAEGEEEEDVTEEEILVGIQMEHERQKIKKDSMKHTQKEDEVNVKNRQRAEETKQRKKAQRKKKKPKNKKKKKRKKSSEAWNDRHDELYDKIVDFYAERELFKKLAKDNKIKSLTRDYIDNEKALFDKLIEKYGVHGQARRSGKENQKKNPKKQNPKEKNTKEKNTKEKNTKEKNTREKNNHNNHYQKSNKSNREADTQYMFGFTEWLDGLSPGLKSLMMHCVVFFMAFTFQMMLLSPAFLLVACHGTIKPPWILYWIGYCGPSGMFKYMLYDCCRLNVIGVKLYHLAKKSSPSSTKYNRYLSTGLFVSIFWCSFVSRLVVYCGSDCVCSFFFLLP